MNFSLDKSFGKRGTATAEKAENVGQSGAVSMTKPDVKPVRPSDRTVFSAMPGWGVVVDLTPRELVDARKLRTLKRFIAVGLLLVIIACGAGFAYAVKHNNDAASDAASATADTAILQQQQGNYSGIVQIESAVQQVKNQVASVMGGDANMPRVLTELRSALPEHMKLLTVVLSFDSPGQSSAGGTDLNATGQTEIGTLVITGSSGSVTDLAAYVDRLQGVPGFVSIIPTSNTKQNGNFTFAVSIVLTDKFLTNRYAVPTTPSTTVASDSAAAQTTADGGQ